MQDSALIARTMDVVHEFMLERNGRARKALADYIRSKGITLKDAKDTWSRFGFSLSLNGTLYPVSLYGYKTESENVTITLSPDAPDAKDIHAVIEETELISEIKGILDSDSISAIKKSFPALYGIIMSEKEKMEKNEKSDTIQPSEFHNLYERTEEFCRRLGLISESDCF